MVVIGPHTPQVIIARKLPPHEELALSRHFRHQSCEVVDGTQYKFHHHDSKGILDNRFGK